VGGERSDIRQNFHILGRPGRGVKIAIANADVRLGVGHVQLFSRRLGYAWRTAQVIDPPGFSIGDAPEVVAPIQIGAAMERAALETKRPGEGDHRRGIHLDQVRAFKKGGQLRRATQEVEAVKIVVGHEVGFGGVDGRFDVVHDLLGPNEIDLGAEDLDPLQRAPRLTKGSAF